MIPNAEQVSASGLLNQSAHAVRHPHHSSRLSGSSYQIPALLDELQNIASLRITVANRLPPALPPRLNSPLIKMRATTAMRMFRQTPRMMRPVPVSERARADWTTLIPRSYRRRTRLVCDEAVAIAEYRRLETTGSTSWNRQLLTANRPHHLPAPSQAQADPC